MFANGSGESCGEQAMKKFKLPTPNKIESSEVSEKVTNVNEIEHETRRETEYDYKFFCSIVDGPSWDEEIEEAQKRIRFSKYLQEVEEQRRETLMREIKMAACPQFNPHEVANKLKSLVDRSKEF